MSVFVAVKSHGHGTKPFEQHPHKLTLSLVDHPACLSILLKVVIKRGAELQQTPVKSVHFQ